MTEIMTGRHVLERIMNFLLPPHLLGLSSLSLLLSNLLLILTSFYLIFLPPMRLFLFFFFSLPYFSEFA
jgi:hypothetical protein